MRDSGIVILDAKRRVALRKYARPEDRIYQITVDAKGQIVLTPYVIVTDETTT